MPHPPIYLCPSVNFVSFGKIITFYPCTSSPYIIQDKNVSGIVKDIYSCRILNMVSHKTLHMTLLKGNCNVEMP